MRKKRHHLHKVVCWDTLQSSSQALDSPNFKPLEKEPELGDRDINGLTEGGAYLSDTRSWSNTPLCAVHGRWDMTAVFKGWGVLLVTGKLMSGWLIGYQETRQRGTPVTIPMKSSHSGDVLI